MVGLLSHIGAGCILGGARINGWMNRPVASQAAAGGVGMAFPGQQRLGIGFDCQGEGWFIACLGLSGGCLPVRSLGSAISSLGLGDE